MRPLPAALVLLCLGAGSCGGGTVSLRYHYPQDQTTTYRWVVDATTTPPGAPAHSLHLEALVRERVIGAVGGGGGRLEVSLEPGEALQDGRHVAPGPALTLDLDVGADGHVARVGQTASLPTAAVSALDLRRLLIEVRPPLPARGIRLRESWNADLPTPGGTTATTIDLRGSGRLERFALRDGRRIASISIDRQGRVGAAPTGDTTQTVTGTETDKTSAEFDIDRGLIIDATSRTLTRVGFATGPVGVSLTTRVTLGG